MILDGHHMVSGFEAVSKDGEECASQGPRSRPPCLNQNLSFPNSECTKTFETHLLQGARTHTASQKTSRSPRHALGQRSTKPRCNFHSSQGFDHYIPLQTYLVRALLQWHVLCRHVCHMWNARACIHTCIQSYSRTTIQSFIHAYLPTYRHTYIHTYRHTDIPTYLHTFIHTYTQTNIHT